MITAYFVYFYPVSLFIVPATWSGIIASRFDSETRGEYSRKWSECQCERLLVQEFRVPRFEFRGTLQPRNPKLETRNYQPTTENRQLTTNESRIPACPARPIGHFVRGHRH